jgi:hypothetical protein
MRRALTISILTGLLLLGAATTGRAQTEGQQAPPTNREPPAKERLLVPEKKLDAGAGEEDEGKLDGPFAFEFLKKLAGDWEGGTGSETGPAAAAVFRSGAGGHVLLGTELPGTADESVGVYALDGRDLVVTFYSSLGNAPRLRFSPGKSYPGKYLFEFAGGVNIDKTKDPHLHEGSIQFIGLDRIRVDWTVFRGRTRGETRSLFLSRRKTP